jgi:Fur family transcriptional regulator, ferric uptake regulator
MSNASAKAHRGRKPARVHRPAGGIRFLVPKKPRRPERDVLHAVARGHSEPPEAIFKHSLERRGLKYTPERREILKAIMSAHSHFDADWLFFEMHKSGAKASRATIYRSLTLLCEVGILREVFRGPHGSYYEHVYGHEHHEHMICLKCGKVLEFSSPRLEALQDKACHVIKFRPVHHHLQVFGYCKACR